MNLPAALALAVSLALLPSSARADISIVDDNKTISVDCVQDPEITLLGNHITVTTTGMCTRISIQGNHATVVGSATSVVVAGNHNSVTLAAADEVNVAGNDNTVTVQKPVKRKAPRVSNMGNNNKVTPAK